MQKNIRFVAPLIGLELTLSACATQYTRNGMGFTGGVEAQMITNDTARISARGNGYTDKARLTDFVLLKAAETASEHGFTHFQILNSSDASRTSTITNPGTATTSVYGNTAFSTYSPGSVDTIVKPGQDTLVKFCAEGPTKCQGLPANEIIQNLGSRYFPKQ